MFLQTPPEPKFGPSVEATFVGTDAPSLVPLATPLASTGVVAAVPVQLPPPGTMREGEPHAAILVRLAKAKPVARADRVVEAVGGLAGLGIEGRPGPARQALLPHRSGLS